MANSKLLKEAIADAKAVRETAIANAKIALEEAFAPKLQSILSKKLQAEMNEEEEEDSEEVEENVDTSKIGAGDNKEPEYDEAHTDLDPETTKQSSEVGAEDSNLDKVDDLKEGEEEEDEESEEVSEAGEPDSDRGGVPADVTNADDASISEDSHDDEEVDENIEEDSHEEEDVDEELDLEAIIRELESDMEEELDDEEEGEVEDIAKDVVDGHEEEHHEGEEQEDEAPADEVAEDSHEEDEVEEDIDLDEILREMGYGEEEEVEEGDHEEVEESNELEETKSELKEAISTIKSLKKTINEVNLLNAKLLFANKLFRSYNLTNDQKVKVVETLDRTTSVREVKLVFSTLAESMKFIGGTKKQKISEGIASKASASTAPKKEIIEESTNAIADRFKKLANII